MGNNPSDRWRGLLAVATLGLALFVLVFGTAVEVARGETPPTAVDAVIERMKHAYDDKEGVQAAFVQTNTGMSYFEPLVMKGTLALKKPRRIRMQYTSPHAKTYLSDGATLWIIDERDRTVTRSRNQVDAVGRIFDFFTGSADVRKDFAVKAGGAADAVDGFDVLEMTPRSPDAGFSKVLVRVHPTTGLVHGVVTVSSFGDRSETVLSDVRSDVELPDAGFTYAPREGFTVVDVD